MVKHALLILIFFLAGTALGAWYLFFYKPTEKRYNKIMCYFITRSVTASSGNFDEKIIALRDFVSENVISIAGYHNRLDTCAIEKLTSGIGWCDQQARVFMQLARSIGITSRLLFLKTKDGVSPHSVAEVLAPDKRWVIVDTAYKIDLINKDGAFATQSDIEEDLSIIRDKKRVKLRSKAEPRLADPEYLSVYYNPPEYVITKSGNEVDFLRFVPLWALRPAVRIINERYLEEQMKPGTEDAYEFKMMKARTLHLLGYSKRSGKLYDEVISDSGNPPLVRKAEFYKAVLLKDEGKYEEARAYITGVLDKEKNTTYRVFLLGLRARVLEKLGRRREAEKDLESIDYNLEA